MIRLALCSPSLLLSPNAPHPKNASNRVLQSEASLHEWLLRCCSEIHVCSDVRSLFTSAACVSVASLFLVLIVAFSHRCYFVHSSFFQSCTLSSAVLQVFVASAHESFGWDAFLRGGLDVMNLEVYNARISPSAGFWVA